MMLLLRVVVVAWLVLCVMVGGDVGVGGGGGVVGVGVGGVGGGVDGGGGDGGGCWRWC